jgi:hypothetical protein
MSSENLTNLPENMYYAKRRLRGAR